MFGKEARDPGADRPTRSADRAGGLFREERRVAAWIGASVVVEGNLTSSEDMTIAGKVEGDVAAREHTVVIAPQGRIQGQIDARSVAVHGRVTGAINARERVEVAETGTVDGDITCPRLVVAEGAVLHGRVGNTRSSAQPA